jgi:hypothetical protein
MRDAMRRVVLMAVLAASLAACRDGARDVRESNERADRALAQVAALRDQVADLQIQVAGLGEELSVLDPQGPGDSDGPEFDEDLARYAAATSSPARAFSIRAMVRSRPKMATKEPKRGPVVCPSSTS